MPPNRNFLIKKVTTKVVLKFLKVKQNREVKQEEKLKHLFRHQSVLVKTTHKT